ncbi:Fic family protein [Bordetella genomosp. 4]|uniref:Cell filamentation protein Fic n=1 Tax=Bordetella genomosp. 4 TaxID=463044 RepID=A0A261UUB0_9BORD|nr:Fic family protein [Bordetella genomosp. 4]OZI64850.1 cell filamentation protein Fic [Bordetella genomosp. 4]
MAIREQILQLLHAQPQPDVRGLSSNEIAHRIAVSVSTVKRYLDVLLQTGEIVREGKGRATRYRVIAPSAVSTIGEPTTSYVPMDPMAWSGAGQALLLELRQPLGAREVAGYQRAFVDNYVPNQSSLLPPVLAQSLYDEGRMKGQQPAGTYARKVLGALLIDLSWSSSRLEGNRYSRLDTEELFKNGSAGNDLDAVMLLNHKIAIEFLVDAVPEYGLTQPLIRNLHAMLMQDLLVDASHLGNVRQKVVNISGTTYVPLQVPSLLEEMLGLVVDKAKLIKNPIEAAFFLWVNLAYLQPFEDGNKRTSRLSANIPLMLYNCAPLSFLSVETPDYAYAMMGVYERCNVALAVDLFESAYRRSVKKYAILLDAMGIPDPVRLRFREALTESVGAVVRDRMNVDAAVALLGLPAPDILQFQPILLRELQALDLYNCARYRLTMTQTRQWIEAGRPH